MENLGILYFSSTGNSLYVAKKLKEKSGGEIKYIPRYEGNGAQYSKVIVVSPVYSFGLPVPVCTLLQTLDKKIELYAVLTYGGMAGGADRLFYEYALQNGLNVKGVYTLQMVENYTLVASPPKFYSKLILKLAEKRIEKIALSLQEGALHLPRNTHTHEKTYLKNKGNWHLIANDFTVTNQCVLCGHCVEICPAQNIRIVNKKVTFGDGCIACLGCFHRCPHHAILYKNKDNKKRYVNPNVDEAQIGKDIK